MGVDLSRFGSLTTDNSGHVEQKMTTTTNKASAPATAAETMQRGGRGQMAKNGRRPGDVLPQGIGEIDSLGRRILAPVAYDAAAGMPTSAKGSGPYREQAPAVSATPSAGVAPFTLSNGKK